MWVELFFIFVLGTLMLYGLQFLHPEDEDDEE